MSQLVMTAEERAAVEAAQRQSQHVRHWKRFHAGLLRADGVPGIVVAQTLGCTPTSVSTWSTAWRARGVAGIREGVHPGAARRFDATGEHALLELVHRNPHAAGQAATGWTVALRQTEVAESGWHASQQTLRRTLHRLGGVGKRPRVVLGRPDPDDDAQKSSYRVVNQPSPATAG
jgi:transposase